LGKRLENFLSLAVSVGCYPVNRYVNHIKRKRKQFTKQGEQYVKLRQGSMPGIMRAELKRLGIQPFFATFAVKEEKKMTHLKQTT
jgi:hypothetical protein